MEINPSTYNIRMFAKTSLGTSKASNVLTITTGEAGVVFLHSLSFLVLCLNVCRCGTSRRTDRPVFSLLKCLPLPGCLSRLKIWQSGNML